MKKLLMRKKSSGQALIETSVVLLLLIFLTIGWLGEGIQIVARVELTNALQLATVSATQAQFAQSVDGIKYAQNTFEQTIANVPFLNKYGLLPGEITFSCNGAYFVAPHPTNISSLTLTCTETGAKVLYKNTPLGLVYPADINLGGAGNSISYTVQAPFFRTCNLARHPCH